MKSVRAASLIVLFFILGIGAGSGTASAEDWKAGYERLCGTNLEDSDASLAELEGVLKEVEELRKTVEAMDFPQKKNYIFRIVKCRDLVKYYIESKQSK